MTTLLFSCVRIGWRSVIWSGLQTPERLEAYRYATTPPEFWVKQTGCQLHGWWQTSPSGAGNVEKTTACFMRSSWRACQSVERHWTQRNSWLACSRFVNRVKNYLLFDNLVWEHDYDQMCEHFHQSFI